MNDWETNPHHYCRDESGEFLLKLDGTPKKKTGRPKVRWTIDVDPIEI